MNTKEKAEIRKEYFEKLLNTEEPSELIKKGNKEIGEVEVEELTMEDVEKAIKSLKNNKAAGTDGINRELIKYGGDKLLNRIYEIVRQIWGRKGYLKNVRPGLNPAVAVGFFGRKISQRAFLRRRSKAVGHMS